MFKKTISYEDYNGNDREDTFYFNLTPTEMTEIEFSVDGGFSSYLESIVKSKNLREIISKFQYIIQKSYGVKSEDGKKFIKNSEILDDFMQSAAYSELFMELATNTDSAIEFVNALFPSDKIQKYTNMAKN